MNQKTFDLLQEQDWDAIGKELTAYGALWAWKYKWRDGNEWELVGGITVVDLVQTVITKTIAGSRKWDPDKGELRPWLRAQLRSEMSHLYHSKTHKHEATVPESEDVKAGEGLLGEIQHSEAKNRVIFGSPMPEPEKALLAKERQEWIDQRANDIYQAVSDDPDLEEMVEAILFKGCEPKNRYLADELGVPATNITNRRKRLKRRASKLMDGEEL